MKQSGEKMNFGQFYSKFGILIILVVLFIVSSLMVPGFFSYDNIMNVLMAIACTTILGLGATFVVILGHINIAYGSELALIGCAACMADVATGSVFAGLVVALVLGIILGALCGFIITKLLL